MDLSLLGYIYLGLAAFLVGFTKTSVGGVGILAVLMVALAIPGKASPGVLLPMLIAADIMAVIYYRRSCQWHILLKLLPPTVIGVIIGYLTIGIIPTEVFVRVIGSVILLMLFLEFFVLGKGRLQAGGYWFTNFIGIFAGIATMIANAAGPVFGIYLLQMGLNKQEFVGTRSWFFLIVNLFKLPFSAGLGLITFDTLTLNLTVLPVILMGAFLGYKVLGYINLALFKWLIRGAVLLAATRLILF